MASHVRCAISGASLLAVLAGVWAYPLWPPVLGAVLVLYGAALWLRPALWLLVIPSILPNLDLSPWTGWLLIQESDFFLLLTLAILLLRMPLVRTDIAVGGIGGAILALFVTATLLNAAIGFFVPGVLGGSSIVYLTEANTLRAAKPLLFALALWPFLRARQRTHGDGLSRLGTGILLGLAGVIALVGLERFTFAALWDFQSDYRVAAAFSSMHVGGGHIGAYLAMALPFLAVPLFRWRARWWPVLALLAVAGGYALIVTYARTAYAAALAGILSTVIGLTLAAFHQSRRWLRGLLAPAVLLLGVAAAVLAASASAYMATRFAGTRADFSVREANWLHGLQVRNHGLLPLAIGSGLGTYPRLWFDRAAPNAGPSNVRLGQDEAGSHITIQGRQPLFVVQKTTAAPAQPLRLDLRLRANKAGAQLTVGLCEKWLLYSFACATAGHRATTPGLWESVSLPLLVPPTPGAPARPIEFYLSVAPGVSIDLSALRLTNPAGTNLLRNGDFSQGIDFWFFTDDNHVLWRIFNQYLTSFFEGGLLGVAALILLLAGGLAGTMRALARGEGEAASLAGALAAFAVSGLFDAPLEAPRLAFLVYLIAFTALALGRPPCPVPQILSQGRDRLGQ